MAGGVTRTEFFRVLKEIRDQLNELSRSTAIRVRAPTVSIDIQAIVNRISDLLTETQSQSTTLSSLDTKATTRDGLLQDLKDNTAPAAGGETIVDQLTDPVSGDSLAEIATEGLINGAQNVVGGLFSAGLSVAAALAIGGVSVLVFSGKSLAELIFDSDAKLATIDSKLGTIDNDTGAIDLKLATTNARLLALEEECEHIWHFHAKYTLTSGFANLRVQWDMPAGQALRGRDGDLLFHVTHIDGDPGFNWDLDFYDIFNGEVMQTIQTASYHSSTAGSATAMTRTRLPWSDNDRLRFDSGGLINGIEGDSIEIWFRAPVCTTQAITSTFWGTSFTVTEVENRIT